MNDLWPIGNASIRAIRGPAAQIAIVGIFLLLLCAALYVGRPLLAPVFTAAVIGVTLAPIVKHASRWGISPWITSLVLSLLLVAVVVLGMTLIASPVAEWIGRAPEIGETIKHKLYVLDRPLAAWRELRRVVTPPTDNTVSVAPSEISILAPVVAFLTPAFAQIVLFLVTLVFFLAVQADFRRHVASLLADREAKLRFLRTASEVEQSLASYLGMVTVVNATLGVIVTLGAWLLGFPNPLLFGIIAGVLNYIPYLGPACTAIILFLVGLVAFPTLSYALIAPACFVLLATLEGQLITPAILGQKFTLNPLALFLAVAFWTWLWGPIGTFLAVPLSIIAQVVSIHFIPLEEEKSPD